MDIRKMSNYELARWAALMEAVNIIAEECESRGKDFETLRIEPLGVRKYIESTCDQFCRRLDEEDEKRKAALNAVDAVNTLISEKRAELVCTTSSDTPSK